ncbi:hypothetical protein [Kitasatospora sp. LaBMicrA B282]|uniref:hypothetical protein n=1 Tax=Kitasatospora sp. LaBMicrA B282 TaxID=3420949 RepID=UPI003D0FCEFD
MDIVYVSLFRRRPDEPVPPGEVAEVIGALWAHSTSDDGLQHASGRSEAERIDLLLYLLTHTEDTPGTPTATALHRVDELLARSQQASPVLGRRYLPHDRLTEPTKRTTR